VFPDALLAQPDNDAIDDSNTVTKQLAKQLMKRLANVLEIALTAQRCCKARHHWQTLTTTTPARTKESGTVNRHERQVRQGRHYTHGMSVEELHG